MTFKHISYNTDGPLATIILNRPQYKNAQDYLMLDEIDAALAQAKEDRDVRVIIVRGSGGNFSSGHDLGTSEAAEYRASLGAEGVVEEYNQFKKYNLDLLLKWRNHPKPTIAMVEGYCIYAGWMLAACLDVVFAAKDARFLAGFVEYMSIPWDIGIRRAKELCFESRFISADEASLYGLVNRVLAPADLEEATYSYARRVAENSPEILRLSKLQMNKAQDLQGYTSALEDSLGDYMTMRSMGMVERAKDTHRLMTVDLAVRGLKGDRYGLEKENQK
ncbi:MAG: enoyl-CoA hydratase-related protein [Desulfobacterales bacterium]